MSDEPGIVDVVHFERGLGVHWHNEWVIDADGDEVALARQEVSPGRCELCAYWPEPPPQFVVTSVDREAGIITITSLR